MKTCPRCGVVSPDSATRCDCGAELRPEEVARAMEGTVAGFWIRVGADLLDAIVLGVVGWVLTLFFREPFARLGERGVFVGLAVSLLYNGVMQSRYGGGQTVAKRLLKLRVVRVDGSLLSLDRSLVRWGLLGFLVYGSAAGYALLSIAPFLGARAVDAAMVGAQLALFVGCGLIVPFHPLKRGLHDLLTGSMVVRGGMPLTEVIQRGLNARRDRRLVVGAVGLALAAAIATFVSFRHTGAELERTMTVSGAIRAAGVDNPSVVDLHQFGTAGSRHTIVVSGFVPSAGTDPDVALTEAHKRIVALVRKQMPLDGVDAIVTTLRTGINIGIYESYRTEVNEEPPREAAAAATPASPP